jgi:3-methyladenine DNA glycosylase/8-oxoguanine DNA glycosylase
VTQALEFRLAGARGERVDLVRTLNSHGFVDLPPMHPAADHRALEITIPLGRGKPRTVRIHPGRQAHGAVTVLGSSLSPAQAERALAAVRHVLRLDADLSPFYALAAEDPDLAWTVAGAGRMIRSPTVFEDVVKTICTTNCTWSATTRMVTALVEHLGERAPTAPPSGALGRAFPTPHAMAAAPESFYRDVVRAGYRGAYLIALSRSVVEGEVDLEALGRTTPGELSDDAVDELLLALPGVGPYAAAHIMMTMGRHSRLILDSWTRPTYAKIVGKKTVRDAAIERRFRRYGPFAGLAFWMFVTRDWVQS